VKLNSVNMRLLRSWSPGYIGILIVVVIHEVILVELNL
jgi:hypothetical protein